MSSLAFSRYLYPKDEIEVNILINLLKRNEEQALFWGYELYHSGFHKDFVDLIWKIYYLFYSTINPSFDKFLATKMNQVELDERNIGIVIKNFIIRRSNMDVFMVKNIVKQFDIEVSDGEEGEDMNVLLEKRDCLAIGGFIETISRDKILENFTIVITHFLSKGLKIDMKKTTQQFQKQLNITNPNILLLSRVIHYYSLLDGIKLGRNLYIIVQENEFDKYKTDEVTVPYKILAKACVYSTDEHKILSLFTTKRETTDIKNAYLNDWLLHASSCPLWRDRIEKHNGKADFMKKYVVFENDDEFELFHESFNLEPDEQKLETQQKTTMEITKTTNWLEFYNEHNKYGVIKIDKEIIEEIEKIHF